MAWWNAGETNEDGHATPPWCGGEQRVDPGISNTIYGETTEMAVSSVSIRWLVVLTVLAIAVVLNACSDSPPPHAGTNSRSDRHSRPGANCYGDTRARPPHIGHGQHRYGGTDCTGHNNTTEGGGA